MLAGVDGMFEKGFENCPETIRAARKEAMECLTDPYIGVFAMLGCGYLNEIGRRRSAKYIVKDALDGHLFDIVIWIFMQQERDWSVRKLQMFISERLGLNLPPSHVTVDDDDDEYMWDEKAVAREIYGSLKNKKFFLILEDPPSKGIQLKMIGVPALNPYDGRKIMIITKSNDVWKVMQTDRNIELCIWNESDFLDLVKEECLDLASSPRFHGHLTQDSILSCFTCILQFLRKGCVSDVLIYCWLGEGLIGGDGHHLDIITKWKMGQHLLLEFARSGLLKEDEQMYYEAYKFARRGLLKEEDEQMYAAAYKGLIDEFLAFDKANLTKTRVIGSENKDLKLEGDENLIFWENSELQQIHHSPRWPKASVLVIWLCDKLEYISDDFFNEIEGVRIVQILGASISSLPTSLTRLAQNLRVLNLRNCRNLRHIPPSIQDLENLEILDLFGTCIIFSSPFECPCRVQLLDLSNNPDLFSLPSSFFSNSTNLEQLLLNDCKSLCDLPDDSFKPLVKLQVLHLSNARSLQSMPSSLWHCVNLKTLVLRDCSTLEIAVSYLHQLQALESLDLSGCCALHDISSFGRFKLPHLRSLDLSRVGTQVVELSLRGYLSLETLELEGVRGVEVLDLSGTKIKRFPHEVCHEGSSLKRLYLLATKDLRQPDWEKIDQPPKELLIWDQCQCNNDEYNYHDLPLVEKFDKEAFISVSNTTKFFKSLSYDSKFFRALSRFHITVSPCSERGGNMLGVNASIASFQRKNFPYQDIYYKSSSSRSSSTTSLTPTIHFAHFKSRRIDGGGGIVEINSGDSFHKNLDNVFGSSSTRFFALLNNKFVASVDQFGDLSQVEECWIERCHAMKEGVRPYSQSGLFSLKNLWVSNLARLTNLFWGSEFDPKGLSCLKEIRLEYCPRLINVFSSIREELSLDSLEILEIRFCGRLEEVFEEDTSKVYGSACRFPRLKTLCLWELSALKTISWAHKMYLPELKKLRVRGCPKLRELPLCLVDLAKSDQKLVIKGEAEWWNNLQWNEDEKECIKSHIDFVGCVPFT